MSTLTISKVFTFSGHESPVYALERFEKNKFFSGGGDRIVSCIDASSDPSAFAIVNTGSTIYSLKYIDSKNILLAGVMEGGIHVIDLKQKKEIRFLVGHHGGVFDIKHSPKNNLVITTGGDGRICFWSAEDFKLKKNVVVCKEKIRCVAISPDENFAAIGCGDGMIRLYSLKDLNQIHQFEAHILSVNAIQFHPFHNTLLSGGRDAHLKIWSTEDWLLIQSVPAHNYAIYSICFSAGLGMFFTASRDKTIKVWQSDRYSFTARIEKENFGGHAFSVNKIITLDDLLISAGDDKTIIGWNVNGPV